MALRGSTSASFGQEGGDESPAVRRDRFRAAIPCLTRRGDRFRAAIPCLTRREDRFRAAIPCLTRRGTDSRRNSVPHTPWEPISRRNSVPHTLWGPISCRNSLSDAARGIDLRRRGGVLGLGCSWLRGFRGRFLFAGVPCVNRGHRCRDEPVELGEMGRGGGRGSIRLHSSATARRRLRRRFSAGR